MQAGRSSHVVIGLLPAGFAFIDTSETQLLTGLCLEELCQAAVACPDTVAPLICQLLDVTPGLSLSSHGLLDLQQQLPLKAVGACLLLPSKVTGEFPQLHVRRG